MADDKDKPSPWANARPGVADRASAKGATRSPSRYTPRDSVRPRAMETTSLDEQGTSTPAREVRWYGLNACLAAFAHRPHALRKAYLSEARIPALKTVLAWCVKQRLGYRIVDDTDLCKLTGSRHHEGVCFDMLREAALGLESLLTRLPSAPGPSLLLWLDGVGNPHNLGALLRSAAHFGAAGVIVPHDQGLEISGAAARVAEGAAEVVPFVLVHSEREALADLRAQGFTLAAAVPREGASLYATSLPARIVLVFGNEGSGLSDTLIEAAHLRLTIPGSGRIESMNVAASVAVVLSEYWRQHGGAPGSAELAIDA